MNDKPPIHDHALETMPDGVGVVIEDRLWWVQGRKAIIRVYLERANRDEEITTIMDIGCGSGGNLDVLGDFGKVIGVEPSKTLARRARSRGIAESILEQDALELDECHAMDLFSMFDVLEHIEDDKTFLTQLQQKASQKHHLLVSVPACQFLYSDHDRILHHYRRYSKFALETSLEEAGYKVIQISYFMFFLFPIALLVRMKDKILKKAERRTTTVEIGDVPRFLSVLFETTLKAEAFLSRRIRFPIGLWLFALAESSDRSQPPQKNDPGVAE